VTGPEFHGTSQGLLRRLFLIHFPPAPQKNGYWSSQMRELNYLPVVYRGHLPVLAMLSRPGNVSQITLIHRNPLRFHFVQCSGSTPKRLIALETSVNDEQL
jgi:hypothetical protein